MLSRPRHVALAIVCRCVSTLSVPVAIAAPDSVDCSESRYCGQRVKQIAIEAPSRAAMYAVAGRVFLVLWEAWCRNTGAASLSPAAAGNQVLLWPPSAAGATICMRAGRLARARAELRGDCGPAGPRRPARPLHVDLAAGLQHEFVPQAPAILELVDLSRVCVRSLRRHI